MKTLRQELFERLGELDPAPTMKSLDEEVDAAVDAVRAWLGAMAQDGQVPANRDLRDEYEFLIKEAGKGLDNA